MGMGAATGGGAPQGQYGPYTAFGMGGASPYATQRQQSYPMQPGESALPWMQAQLNAGQYGPAQAGQTGLAGLGGGSSYGYGGQFQAPQTNLMTGYGGQQGYPMMSSGMGK